MTVIPMTSLCSFEQTCINYAWVLGCFPLLLVVLCVLAMSTSMLQQWGEKRSKCCRCEKARWDTIKITPCHFSLTPWLLTKIILGCQYSGASRGLVLLLSEKMIAENLLINRVCILLSYFVALIIMLWGEKAFHRHPGLLNTETF